MTAAQFARVESLFDQACERPVTQRAAWVNAQCTDDPAVLRKVLGMLDAHADSASAFEQPALGAHFHVGGVDDDERRLRAEFAAMGRYEISSLLGEGGFGRVYQAEQREPIRRSVALKVLKLGMDTRRVLARFDAERQTLAMMNHPGIARVFDAGATPSGRPYFSMELIDGHPITRYCDDERLDVRARVQLFVRVCDAMRHAHQKGVLHRDIKPSNVLVAVEQIDGVPHALAARSREPFIKIIDFGIARALAEPSGATVMTEQGHMIGTPEYMSPEQATGSADIDTRTDIYSLGVLLYELLAGAPPIDRKSAGGASPMELQRLICEVEPQRPSERLRRQHRDSGSATARDGASGASRGAPMMRAQAVSGDLDWIVMKALEKDRARRYETVDALADDLARYLRDEAVVARPPTITYRFQKFSRRHRGALAASAALIVVLVGGVIGTTIGLLRAREEAAVACNESSVARAVTDFLNEDLLAAISPDQLGASASMHDVVRVASQRIEGRFPDQPLAEAAVHLSLGRTLMKLADIPTALRHLQRCATLRESRLGPTHPATLEALFELAQALKLDEGNAEAQVLLERVYAQRAKTLGENHADTIAALYELSVALAEQGFYDQASPKLERSLELSAAALGDSHPLTLHIMRGAGILCMTLRDGACAGRHFEGAYRLALAALGNEHPTTLLAIKDYSTLLLNTNRAAEAEAILRPALQSSRRIRGPEHPATLMIICNIADAVSKLDRDVESEPLLRDALATAERTLPAGHSVTTAIQAQLGLLCAKLHRLDEAEAILLNCHAGRESTFGKSHPLTLEAAALLREFYRTTERPEKAAEWGARATAQDPAHEHK